MVVPLALVQQVPASPEDVASSEFVSYLRDHDLVSVGRTFCTCTSKAARSDFVLKLLLCPPQLLQLLRLLHHHSHAYHLIKILILRNFQHLLYCLDDWYLVLYRYWDIHDLLSVLDLWELHDLPHLWIAPVMHHNGMNCACGFSTVFRKFWMIGTCLCITGSSP